MPKDLDPATRAVFVKAVLGDLEELLVEEAEVPVAIVVYSTTAHTLGLRLSGAWPPEIMDEVIQHLRGALNELLVDRSELN
jgi:hypothetical protein